MASFLWYSFAMPSESTTLEKLFISQWLYLSTSNYDRSLSVVTLVEFFALNLLDDFVSVLPLPTMWRSA
jgi:hypothetical protein